MLRLVSLLYMIVGASLAGAFVIAVLVMGMDEPMPIIYAAAAGMILGLPVSWAIAKRIK